MTLFSIFEGGDHRTRCSRKKIVFFGRARILKNADTKNRKRINYLHSQINFLKKYHIFGLFMEGEHFANILNIYF